MRRRVWIGVFAVSLAAILAVVPAASAKVWTSVPDWVGSKRNLKIYVPPNSPPGFVQAVQAAIAAWNGNAGGWSLSTTSDPGAADVDVNSADPGDGNDGLTTVTGTTVGGANTTHMTVKINPNISGNRLLSVIMHELGHCMRMAHTVAVGDLMEPSASGKPTTPSNEDKKEAEASNKTPGRVYRAPSYLVQGVANQTLHLYPDSTLSFANLDSVAVSPTTGTAVSYSVVGFNSTSIGLSVSVGMGARHNEGFEVELTYQDHSVIVTHGLLVTAATALDPGDGPHAVAGDNITADAYEDILLDGTSSYHDVSSLTSEMALCWFVEVDGGDDFWVLDGYSTIQLPAGSHTATLFALDYYGLEASDTITITVN